jgi:hypothetical protein
MGRALSAIASGVVLTALYGCTGFIDVADATVSVANAGGGSGGGSAAMIGHGPSGDGLAEMTRGGASSGGGSTGGGGGSAPAVPIVDVLVGSGGVRLSSGDLGKTWQYTNDQITDNDCWGYRAIAYGGGMFVATTGTGGFGRISSSPDGVHWREFESNIGADGITYGGGKFVANSFTSSDGYSFNFRSPNVDMGKHAALAYLDGTFFLTGALNGIAVSTDGDNFTITLPNYTSPDFLDYYSNITQFAVGNGTVVGIAPQRIVTSSDRGQTWTNQDDFFGYGGAQPTQPTDWNYITGVFFDGSQFIVYGLTGDNRTVPTKWTSKTGLNWTMSALTTAAPFGGLPSSHLVAVGRWYLPSEVLSSVDLGATWSEATSVALSTFYDFSTPQVPVANPPILDFTNYNLNAMASGEPSSDPNTAPMLPPSVLYTHDQLLQTACGNSLPPGR